MKDKELETTDIGEQPMPETPAETSPETPVRHPIFERAKGYYPDREMSTDEDYYNALDEKLTENDTYRTENESANQSVIDALTSEPLLVKLIQDINNGATFIEALALHVDPSELELVQGDPDFDKWAANKAQREANAKAYKDFMAEVEGNVQASQQAVKAFAETNGLSEVQATEFMSTLQEILADAYKGKITEPTLTKIYKAMIHDSAVQEAAIEGEIKGRNENIELMKEKDEPADLPVIPNSSKPPVEQTPKPKSYGRSFVEEALS